MQRRLKLHIYAIYGTMLSILERVMTPKEKHADQKMNNPSHSAISISGRGPDLLDTLDYLSRPANSPDKLASGYGMLIE